MEPKRIPLTDHIKTKEVRKLPLISIYNNKMLDDICESLSYRADRPQETTEKENDENFSDRIQ